MHLEAAQAEFLARLGKSPEGQQLKVLIAALVEDSNEKLRKLTGDLLYREQGRATAHVELLELLSAPDRVRPRNLSRHLPMSTDFLP